MIRTLTIIVFGTLFVAAVFTPAVYSALGYFLGEVPWPFSRVFDRVAMLVILVFIILMRKDFSLSELRGYFRRERLRGEWKPLVAGAVLTVGVTLCMLPFMVGDGRLDWANKEFSQYSLRLLKVVPAALLISALEESFFRVLLFQRLRDSMKLPFAVVICSLVYAIAHFISPAKQWQYPGYSVTIGFEYLAAVFDRLLLPGVLPAFFGLFLVGVVLCIVIWRTRSLLLCLGLHAGWVIAIKIAGFSTEKTANFAYAEGVGRRYFLVAEPLAWVSIVLVGVIVLWGFTKLWSSSLEVTVE